MVATGRPGDGRSGPTGPEPEPERHAAACWYACYTRARHEKRVATALAERGVEAFLPLVARRRQWKDRQKTVHFPLFPGYVFGRFALRDLYTVLTIPGVATLVRTGDVPTPIADAEIENVRLFAEALAESRTEAVARPYVVEGDRVLIVEGPFQGIEGIVVQRRGRSRVLVGLEAIGQGLEVDVDSARLVRVAPAAARRTESRYGG